jgi:hypothetical protein
MIFLFSGKEDELCMQGVYSYGTGPEEKAKSDTTRSREQKGAIDDTT